MILKPKANHGALGLFFCFQKIATTIVSLIKILRYNKREICIDCN